MTAGAREPENTHGRPSRASGKEQSKLEPVTGSGARVAVVTGGASGIGRGAALSLGKDGFDVAVLDVDLPGAQVTAKGIEATGSRSIAVAVDVSSEAGVRAAFVRVAEELGVPYALVNSAGILRRSAFTEMSLEEWRRVLDINLTGTFLCCRELARLLGQAKSPGRIVNIASVHSLAPGVGLGHYDASKGGIWMLTKSLARELGPDGILVNAVGPGLVVGTALTGGPSESYLAQTLPALPLKRAGRPEDIAGAISFLCSDAASYMTGSMVIIDGGMLVTAQT